MKKSILSFIVFLCFSIILLSKTYSIPVSNFEEKQILVINQTGIDKNIQYTFSEINNTLWIAEFRITNPTLNFNTNNYLLQSFNSEMTFDNAIRYYDFLKYGYFYIYFPKGFKSGLSAKFGLNSTIINTTTTTPFYPSQRVICHGIGNNTNIVFKKDAVTISYSKSTNNGLTWVTNNTIINGTGQKATPSISCDSQNIAIAYLNNTGTTYHVTVLVSTNNGSTFTTYVPVKANISSTYGTTPNIVLNGQNISLSWITSGTKIIYINSSNLGVTWSNQIDVYHVPLITELPECTPLMPPFTFWNYYYSTMEKNQNDVFIGAIGGKVVWYYNVLDDDCFFDYVPTYRFTFYNSTDQGLTWSNSSVVFSGTNPCLYPSLTISNSTHFYTSCHLSTVNDVYVINTTNSGVTWNTPLRIDTIGSGSAKAQNPTITTNSTGYPIVFYQQDNVTLNRDNIVYRNFNGSAWIPLNTINNLTTDNLQNQFPNSEVNFTANCNVLVFVNGTASLKNITYANFGVCQYITVTTTTTTTTTSTTTTIPTTTTTLPTTTTSTTTTSTTTTTTTTTIEIPVTTKFNIYELLIFYHNTDKELSKKHTNSYFYGLINYIRGIFKWI